MKGPPQGRAIQCRIYSELSIILDWQHPKAIFDHLINLETAVVLRPFRGRLTGNLRAMTSDIFKKWFLS